MAQVVIYTTSYCPYCTGAKAFLRSKNVEFEEIDVTHDAEKRAEMEHLSQRWTVPQIFIDGRPIGGYDDMRRLDDNGELDPLLGRDGQSLHAFNESLDLYFSCVALNWFSAD